ncbi:hypothetical protein IGB42_00256 [Andreprevotia sp. IGB-42]|nr:hypothetical protein IGB42_00256 [Andreprevotia sp. IGB-42]
MIVQLHRRARTTPAVRAEIQAAPDSLSDAELARRYNVSSPTIAKWRRRNTVLDESHTAYHLQTTLTPAQEHIAVELRKLLQLGLDDLLVVVREFLNPAVSRAGLGRCLARHGVGSLRALVPVTPSPRSKPFKDYAPGFVHIDIKYLPQMADETRRRYLFVAIDRATRWVFVQGKPSKTAAAASAFLAALTKAAPFKVQKLLTDNGSEFTDRLFNKQSRPAASMNSTGCAPPWASSIA